MTNNHHLNLKLFGVLMKKLFFLILIFCSNFFSAYGEDITNPLSRSEVLNKLKEFNVQIPSDVEGWATDFIPFGAGGYIFAMHRSDNNIYVGGEFSSIGNIKAFGIARFEISTGQWHQVGGGVRKPPISTLQEDLPGRVMDITSDSAGNIYIAGLFYVPNVSGANSIAKWDGTNWSPIGYGTGDNPGTVSCITVRNNIVYAGGSFFRVYDNSFTSLFVNRIAKFNMISNTWSAMGSGIEDSFELIPVRDLTSDNEYVYAGGSFGLAGGITVHQIARWNIVSSVWEDMGGGVYNNFIASEPGVKSLEILPSGILAVGGNFEQPSLNVAFWSNTTGWGAVSSAGIISAMVEDIDYSNGSLFASVTSYTGANFYVLKFNNVSGSWDFVSESTDGYIEAICGTSTNTFFIGGSFSKINSVTALHPVGIAYYNSSSYEEVNGSITSYGSIFKRSPYFDGSFMVNNDSEPSYIHAITSIDSNIYFGGQFESAGNLSIHANNIVGYNKYTHKWFALNGGVDYFGGPPVQCLEADTVNKVLYVGGYFRKQINESQSAFYIAKYNTQTGEWSRMTGSGTTTTNGIWALKYHYPTSSLYASGSISIGKSETVYIAKWDGSSFSKAGTGITTVAYALETIGNTLYAGGNFNIFSSAGQLNRIAQYNITTGETGEWVPVGQGFTNSLTSGDASVLCLKKFGSVLYAGGGFTNSGSRIVRNVAFWNGTDWLPLGDGLWNFNNSYLLSVKTMDIAADGSVFVAGIFNNAGNASAKNSAVFRNNQWYSLGQGLESQSGNFMGKAPMSSAINGNDWFIGGDFEQAGGNPSYKLARYSGVSNSAVNPPEAYVNRTINSSGLYNFNDSTGSTGIGINLNASGQGYIGVSRYGEGPENVSFTRSSDPANISDYRFVVSQSGLSDINAEVRFVISQIPNNGIIDISDVTVYKRAIPGQGMFDSVYTTYSGDTIIAHVNSFSEFIFGSDTNPLPVELISFTSLVNANSVELNWSTEFEQNNSGFDIERQIINGSDSWIKIANVQGNGNSNEPKNYTYTDNGLQTGKYSYRLKQMDYNGNFEYFNLDSEVEVGVPKDFALSQNYPNPFNPVTKINYDIPKDGKVNLIIYDVTGREVAALVNNELQPAGYYTITFNAINLSSGVYFCRLVAGDFVSTKKLVLLK